MTMNKIIDKLRCHNQEKYRILGICIFLSVLLVTAFTAMYFSSSVQRLLPQGGDTRKLAGLLLGVTIIGCTIFTVYGSNLFYKYKSREFGVMLALGERKRKLGRWLGAELAAIICKYSLLGLIAAVPTSFLIWKLFSVLVISTENLRYSVSIGGILAGALFAVFLTGVILLAGRRFIRRANIMDILNDQRKTELVKEISPRTGRIGIALIVIGLFLALGVPAIVTKLFLFLLPSIWNVTYLLCIAGLYLFMLSAVGSRKKGKHPEKYYKNIISTNLMRFTARQTTRNMCVITLLVFVLLISVFWGAMYFNSASAVGDATPYGYTLHFPALENQLTRQDTFEIAQKHQVTVTDYKEADALNLVIDYTRRDMNDNGAYFDYSSEKLALFLSASDFTGLSGDAVSLEKGEYMTIVPEGYQRTIWWGPDCLNTVTAPSDGSSIRPEFKGTVVFNNLDESVSDPFTFVLSDEDYAYFADKAGDADRERLVLFNTDGTGDEYSFAREWKNEYILHASQLSARIGLYDAWEEQTAVREGLSYSYEHRPTLSADNVNLMGDWKYKPFSKLLAKADNMQLIAVFVLLSFYIAVISLASVGIMTYVRSLNIAMDNRQLFIDLKKLGANQAYRKRAIRMQLRRIFTYPAAAGSLVVMIFALFMTVFNDMRLSPFEAKMLIMEAGFLVLNAVYFYVIYRVSLQKTNKIVMEEA